MNLKNVEFFNVGALEQIAGFGDQACMRIPQAVRNCLNNRARFVAMDSVGCEMRFVTPSPNVDVYVSCLKPEFSDTGELRVYRGSFLCQTISIEPGKIHNLRLTPPPSFGVASEAALTSGGYAANVWRVVCNRGACVLFHGVNTHGEDIRAPKKAELPAKNWLAYGSSITNSSLDGYEHVAATRLGVQVQNKGLSGACQIEKEVVDYMVDNCSWDFATCELGINMRGGFSPEDFGKRAKYLIDRFVGTGKPTFIISLFPNGNSKKFVAKPTPATECEEAYNSILEDLVEQTNVPHLHFIPGDKVLDDFIGLGGDLLHPTAYGHAVMGMNLATILKVSGIGL
jgi:hypothetical protein